MIRSMEKEERLKREFMRDKVYTRKVITEKYTERWGGIESGWIVNGKPTYEAIIH